MSNKGQNDGYNLSKRGKVQVAKHEQRRQNFTSYQLKTVKNREGETGRKGQEREKPHYIMGTRFLFGDKK